MPGFGGKAPQTWVAGAMAAAALVGLVAYAWITNSPSTPGRDLPAASTGTPSLTRSPSSTSHQGSPAASRLVVVAQINTGGDVLIDERLTWRSTPGTDLMNFGLPTRLGGAGLPDGAVAVPVVNELRVSYDGLMIVP